jgi:anti-sigma factor RsiW
MMECDEARKRLPLSIDRELDASGQLELDAHIAGCADCELHTRRLRTLAAAVRATATYHRAPDGLRQRILTALPAAREVRAGAAPRWRLSWTLGAAWASAACAGVALAVVLAQRPSVQDRIDQEAVSSHARALLSEHPIEVASTDQHTVKPWFNGRVDFSPPVRDLSSAGFALAGGRLDYVDRQRVAALVYRHGPHLIDVFVWPGGALAASPVRERVLQGFQVDSWSAGGMTFRAVSDMAPAEMRRLVELLRAADSP